MESSRAVTKAGTLIVHAHVQDTKQGQLMIQTNERRQSKDQKSGVFG